jgi:hypothetical protein
MCLILAISPKLAAELMYWGEGGGGGQVSDRSTLLPVPDSSPFPPSWLLSRCTGEREVTGDR